MQPAMDFFHFSPLSQKRILFDISIVLIDLDVKLFQQHIRINLLMTPNEYRKKLQSCDDFLLPEKRGAIKRSSMMQISMDQTEGYRRFGAGDVIEQG